MGGKVWYSAKHMQKTCHGFSCSYLYPSVSCDCLVVSVLVDSAVSALSLTKENALYYPVNLEHFIGQNIQHYYFIMANYVEQQ